MVAIFGVCRKRLTLGEIGWYLRDLLYVFSDMQASIMAKTRFAAILTEHLNIILALKRCTAVKMKITIGILLNTGQIWRLT